MPERPKSNDIIGPYLVRGHLGTRGPGQADVYLADHKSGQRQVSLTVLRPEDIDDPAARQRFFAEASALATVRSNNLVEIYDVINAPPWPCFASELLRAHALSELIQKEGKLLLPRALHIAGQICAGLGAAHDAGVVHRALRPHSVFLVDRPGVGHVVKLVDFVGDPTIIVEAALPYMAPELHRGEIGDHRADIYAFGAILYELTTGRRPFGAKDAAGLRRAHLEDTAAPPTMFVGMPQTLELLIEHCLTKQPDGRPDMIHEVQASLREVAALLEAFRPDDPADVAVPGWLVVPGRQSRPAAPAALTPGGPEAVGLAAAAGNEADASDLPEAEPDEMAFADDDALVSISPLLTSSPPAAAAPPPLELFASPLTPASAGSAGTVPAPWGAAASPTAVPPPASSSAAATAIGSRAGSLPLASSSLFPSPLSPSPLSPSPLDPSPLSPFADAVPSFRAPVVADGTPETSTAVPRPVSQLDTPAAEAAPRFDPPPAPAAIASPFAAAAVLAESPFDAPAELKAGQAQPLELDEPEAPPPPTTTTTPTTSLASSTEEPPPAALGTLLEPVAPAWPPASTPGLPLQGRSGPGGAPRSRGKLLAAAAVAFVVIAGATLALTSGEPAPTVVAVVEPPVPVVEPPAPVVEPPAPVVEPPAPVVEPPPPVVEPPPPVVEPPPPPVVEPPPPGPEPVLARDVEVTFASIPVGAAVFVGAEAIGVTPLTRRMPASKAATRITFRYDGYLPATKQVVLKEGARVGIVLTPARAATKPGVEKKPTAAEGTLKEGALVNPFKKKKK